MIPLIFGSPGRYIQGPGVLAQAGAVLRSCGPAAALVLDEIVRPLVEPPVAASCAEAGVALHVVEFGGELTPEAAARLVAAIAPLGVDTVMAAGGGKGLDAGKAAAHRLGAHYVSAPTAASTDAPTSKNYVLYDEAHRMVEVGHLPASPRAVIVDTGVLACAPPALLLSGIGDALTKAFEAEQCAKAGGLNMFGARPSLAGLALAREGYRLVRLHAEAGLAQAGSGRSTPEFEALIEAVLLMSGLGFESGGLSFAHALVRGLSLIPGPKDAAHGLQVAYGLLVQLALEDRPPAFMDDLRGFLDRVGLPRTLAALGAAAPDEAMFRAIAEPTLRAPHARNFERTVTADDLVRALRDTEAAR